VSLASRSSPWAGPGSRESPPGLAARPGAAVAAWRLAGISTVSEVTLFHIWYVFVYLA
jgi:hypothetical protein